MGELSRFIVAIFLPSMLLYFCNLSMWIYYPSEELLKFDFTLFSTIFIFVTFYALSIFISQYKVVKKKERAVKKIKTIKKKK